MSRRAFVFILPLLLGACAGAGAPRCYVTLDPAGQPVAEACDEGGRLVVRGITPDNGAFFTPPYVLGALMEEGYIAGEAEASPAAGTTGVVLK